MHSLTRIIDRWTTKGLFSKGTMYVSFFFLCQQTKRHKFKSLSGKRLIVLNCSEVFPVTSLLGLHNSLCIFKTKASRGTKLCIYFNFYSLYNIWKDQLHKISGSQFCEWLFGTFDCETGPRPFLERPGNLSGPKSNSWNYDPLAVKSCSFNMFHIQGKAK